MAKICVHAFVSGRVQGVWYRQSTQQKALSCGVKGWAKNLADGRVEVMLCGEEDAVKEVVAWLHQGPANARVDRVEAQPLEWQPWEDFKMLCERDLNYRRQI